MDTTPNLGLPYIAAAQAQKHVTHNEAIRALDAILQLGVLDRDLASPPASPVDGARYIVAAAAAGAWAGRTGHVAAWQDGAWEFHVPREGWVAWIADEDLLCAWNGSAWVSAGLSVNPTPLVGVNATADATNRLAVASAASLFNHAGAGHQQKINKNAAGDTASLLFQTGFSGRAEIGTTGDDDLHFKVSADGATWVDALRFLSSGHALLGIGLSIGTTASSINNASTIAPKVIFGGTGVSAAMQIVRHTSPGAGGPQHILSSTRGTDVNQYGAVLANDGLGTFQFSGTDGTRFQPGAAIQAYATANAATDSLKGGLKLLTSAGTASNTQSEALRIDENQASRFLGVPQPFTDNATTLGTASARWSVVYAATGTINTSDAREKAVVADGGATLAALAASMLDRVEPILFRWNVGAVDMVPDGFDEGGEGEARVARFRPVERPGRRLHAGFRAQDIKAVLDTAGVDIGLWGLEDASDPESRQWLRPDQMVPLLWAAVRELKAEVAALKARVEAGT